MPKAEIVYFSQMLIVYVIIITSITNLSLQNGSTELWISLLSSCIGYALPNNGKASPSPLREVPEAIGWQNNGEENAEPAQKT